jgi:hypothetical protein
MSDLEQRILNWNRQQEARESGQAGFTRAETTAESNARIAAENRARSQQLGLGKTKSRRQQAEAALTREQTAVRAQQLLDAAAAAHDDDDLWVQTYDEDGFPGDNVNPTFEDLTAKLIQLPGSEEFVAALDEHTGWGVVDEVAAMVAERDRLASLAGHQQRLEKTLAGLQEGSEKLQKRTLEILSLNKQFDPHHEDLVAEIDRLLAQAKSADLEADKKFFIGQVKALEVEQVRRGQALEMATSVFSDWLQENQSTAANFDEAEQAFIASLQMADATYEASIAAERRTASIQASANERGISDESRSADGKVVLTDGRSTYEVSDDGVGALLAAGFQPIREFVAEPEPDLEGALFGGVPDDLVAAEQFASQWNARDHEQENQEKVSVSELGEEQIAAAKAAEEARADAGNTSVIREMEERLGGGS